MLKKLFPAFFVFVIVQSSSYVVAKYRVCFSHGTIIMGITAALCGWIVISIAVTVSLMQCHQEQANKFVEWYVEKLPDRNHAFLAGEITPVWLAFVDKYTRKIAYERQRDGIVGNAVAFWEIDDKLHDIRTYKRSIELNEGNISETTNKIRRTPMRKPAVKILYPSILVQLEYKDIWPTDFDKEQDLIIKRILYALAFWNGVSYRLRTIPSLNIQPRIAGIVIARSGNDTTIGSRKYPTTGRNLSEELSRVIKYWDTIRNNQISIRPTKDFDYGAYDIVATLTDAKITRNTFKGVSSTDPPCDSSNGNKLSGLMVLDDFAFSGLQQAIFQMRLILGVRPRTRTECTQIFKNFADQRRCSREIIGKPFKFDDVKCMKRPKEYYPPGHSVRIILPGDLIPASKLCTARGWVDGYVCWNYVTCEKLYCANNYWYSVCKNSGESLDGMTCAEGKLCLAGKCVNNTSSMTDSDGAINKY